MTKAIASRWTPSPPPFLLLLFLLGSLLFRRGHKRRWCGQVGSSPSIYSPSSCTYSSARSFVREQLGWWGKSGRASGGGRVGPSSDSVITRTDYHHGAAARLRAQWRRPTRSVTRVSPEKLLTRQPRTGRFTSRGPWLFVWRCTHTTRAWFKCKFRASIETEGIRYVGATWIVFRDRRLVQELYRPSPPPPPPLLLVSLGSVAPALLPFSRWRGWKVLFSDSRVIRECHESWIPDRRSWRRKNDLGIFFKFLFLSWLVRGGDYAWTRICR